MVYEFGDDEFPGFSAQTSHPGRPNIKKPPQVRTCAALGFWEATYAPGPIGELTGLVSAADEARLPSRRDAKGCL